MTRIRLITVFLLCTGAFALSGFDNAIQAQVKPFKIKGAGIANYLPLPGDNPQAHFATGNASFLGNYFGQGMLQTDMFTSPNTAAFSSAVPFVFTAANGDDLAFNYGRVDAGAAVPGKVTLFPAEGGLVVAVFVAEFNPALELCTGRFKKVVGGSFMMTAISEPFLFGGKDPVGYSWEGEGSLEFRKGKR